MSTKTLSKHRAYQKAIDAIEIQNIHPQVDELMKLVSKQFFDAGWQAAYDQVAKDLGINGRARQKSLT